MPYIYTLRNRNPHGTTCARCAALIGNEYTRDDCPELPIHYGCYCYYEKRWVPEEIEQVHIEYRTDTTIQPNKPNKPLIAQFLTSLTEDT